MKDSYDLSKLKIKKRINSRTKGNNFERKIAKLLNDKFKTNEFCRTPGSGAFATIHALPSHIILSGDLITPQNFKFYLELKKGYNDFNFSDLLVKTSDLWCIINENLVKASKINRELMIIINQDRKKALSIVKAYMFPNINNTIKFDNYKMVLLEEVLKQDNYLFFN